MTMLEDLYKVRDVINSCTNSRHNNTAYRLVQLYEKKWKHQPSADYLYERVDLNLVDICEGTMTAVRAFSVETKADKDERLKREWIQRGVGYTFAIKLFDGTTLQEIADAYNLMESLWDSSDNDKNPVDSWLTPEESVDEELTYWGD